MIDGSPNFQIAKYIKLETLVHLIAYLFAHLVLLIELLVFFKILKSGFNIDFPMRE